MYVAKRAFRNYNQMVLPGSVVEPESTKWFKTRLKDNTIIEINAHNFNQWAEYFKEKFGVTLKQEEPKDENKNNGVDASASVDVSTSKSDEEPKEVPKVVKVVVTAES